MRCCHGSVPCSAPHGPNGPDLARHAPSSPAPSSRHRRGQSPCCFRAETPLAPCRGGSPHRQGATSTDGLHCQTVLGSDGDDRINTDEISVTGGNGNRPDTTKANACVDMQRDDECPLLGGQGTWR